MVDIIIPTCKNAQELSPLMSEIEGFSLGCRVIATCTKASAALNRNIGLGATSSDIVIMVDDDMAGFYDGWWQELIRPLKEDPAVYMVSARLTKADGKDGAMMFAGSTAGDTCVVARVPTACVAFRRTDIWFDETFIGSGYEDDDFCAQMAREFPQGKVVINNRVRLIHLNEMKNQNGEYYSKNRAYFESKWLTVESNATRVDMFWNIPQILHFVWIGCELPAWAKANIAEWRRLNPEFEIKMHGEEVLDPRFKDHYARINHPQHALAIRSDLLRLSALLRHGGWYWDTDFWPLVSCREMVNRAGNLHKKTLLFARKDKEVVANGAIATRKDAPGLLALVELVLSQRMAHPEWWDYGTYCTREAIKRHAQLYCVHPLSNIIPFTGKDAALSAMRSKDKIAETKAAGHWAIHFEMQTSTDIGVELCTTQSTDKTDGLTKKSLAEKPAECLSKPEQLTDSLPATASFSSKSSGGPDCAPKPIRKRTKNSKATATALPNTVPFGTDQDARSNFSNSPTATLDGPELPRQLSPSTMNESTSELLQKTGN